MNPLVSIVFTSYNHKEYLQQALNCLVNQTYKNYELIIIDDCSTDGSQEILNSYFKNYSHLINLFLLEKNSGSYVKASNYGAKQAKGEYLLFAQCDDYCENNQIEKLTRTFDHYPNLGVVYSRSNLVNEKGKFISDDYTIRSLAFQKKCKTNTIIEGKQMRSFLTHSCVIPNLSAAMIRKSLFVENEGLSERYLVAADWAFWLDLSEKTDFYYLTEPLNYFRQHETTIRSSIKISRQINEFYTIFYNHIQKYKLNYFNSLAFRIGAARVWLRYGFEDKKTFKTSFFELLGKIRKFDRFILFLLILAGIIMLKDAILFKLKKLRVIKVSFV